MAIDLLDLSPCGQNPIDLEDALKHPERARMVQLDSPSKSVLKLRRVYKIDLGGVAPPSWIGELRHLRSIICMANVKKLPEALLKLPHLRFLHFDDSSLETLDGVEKLRALHTITVCRTPAAENAEAIAALAKKIKGAQVGDLMPGIEVERKPAKAPRAKAALVKAMQSDALDDQSDLRKADLGGTTFQDLYITYDLRGANLAGTTWLRCDFEWAKLSGANLAGATFDNCYFSSAKLDGVKARGVRFVRCGGDLELEGADLTLAKFEDLESDTRFTLDKADGSGMQLHATFCSEKEHLMTAKGADLRGARISFDVTPDRRATIAKKQGSRFAWKMDHLKGAKTDKATQITYAPLDAGKAKSADKPAVDERGPAAKALGTFHAANASLWLLAVDAGEAAAWRGAVDENDKRDDFQRALAKESGSLAVGNATGVIAHVGYNGWSHIWEVEGGIALVDCTMQIDDRAALEKALAVRVAQWPPKRTSKIGSVVVKSGVLAIMLPYRDGTFTPAQLKKAAAGTFVKDGDHDRALVPLPNGTYDVVWHAFGPKPDYEDEVGHYEGCTRIIRTR